MKKHALPKIAVIGAGWAGLSAAVQLDRQAQVSLFEASKQAGGRARALGIADHDFSFLDNGQHILLNAYHSVQTLLHRIGVNPDKAFLRLPMQWHMADGIQFQAASLPAPLHLLVALLRAKGLHFSEKVRLLNDLKALQKWHEQALPDMSVAAWLRHRQISQKITFSFWQPLVWGALNTPLENASLRTLGNVLADGVWSKRENSDYLLPKQDLGKIMAEPALQFLRQRGVNVQLETRVAQLANFPDGRVDVNGEAFDAVILAVAPYHATALMPSETPAHIQAAYYNMHYHAITTVYLRYAQAVNLPSAMTGLAEGTAQWFISRQALSGTNNEVVAVISLSDEIGHLKNEEWIARAHTDLLRLCPDLCEPIAAQAITEKRATIASSIRRAQPDLAWLHHHNIYPAGDYLHARYPATLEAAVQSGQNAAALCLNNLKGRKKHDPTQ